MTDILGHFKRIALYVLQLLPGVRVAIANPETKGQCADSHLGEVTHLLVEFTLPGRANLFSL